MSKPRPQDDEAFGEIVRWLKENRIVARVTLSGRLTLTDAEDFYDEDQSPYRPRRAVQGTGE